MVRIAVQQRINPSLTGLGAACDHRARGMGSQAPSMPVSAISRKAAWSGVPARNDESPPAAGSRGQAISIFFVVGGVGDHGE